MGSHSGAFCLKRLARIRADKFLEGSGVGIHIALCSLRLFAILSVMFCFAQCSFQIYDLFFANGNSLCGIVHW